MAIKKIKDIYKDYFQKSKVFLYPALGHNKSSGITPIETYMSWQGVIELEDVKLACLFHLRDDEEFLRFEEKHLYGHPLFDEYTEVDHLKAVYTFDFSKFKDDFLAVKNGKYSKISKIQKDKIGDYYGRNTANYSFIHSFLNPDKYWDQYAKFLCAKDQDIPEMISILKDVGELCSKPNLEKERLKMKIKTLQLGN